MFAVLVGLSLTIAANGGPPAPAGGNGAARGVLRSWPGRSRQAAPRARHCPKALPAATRCYAGSDVNGAYYWIAVPLHWNHVLVVHAHGGPSLAPPKATSPVSALQRSAVIVAEGFAYAGSSYRHAGFGVRDAAEDTDNLRKIFWTAFGRPHYTLLHGQSWGANVAEKTAEIYGVEKGRPVYDGVVLTSGILGGAMSYDFRADLRAVYQFYCHNLPRPDEPAYPLWQGLAADSTLKMKDIDARVNECTGVNEPASRRTAVQQRALTNILNIIHVPERSLVSHMDWATLTFRDLVLRQLRGKSPFSNIGVVYAGSDDDAALNNGVDRFAATRQGVDLLSYDADMTGRLNVPTLTMHAEDDPTAFVELEHAFSEKVAEAGRLRLLMQSFTTEHNHANEATPEYAALFRAMMDWITRGDRPTGSSLEALCESAKTSYGEECHFDPLFVPKPLSTRVYRRVMSPPEN